MNNNSSITHFVLLPIVTGLIFGCSTAHNHQQHMKNTLEENPELVMSVVEKHADQLPKTTPDPSTEKEERQKKSNEEHTRKKGQNANREITEKQLHNILQEHPDVVLQVIKNHPEQFIKTIRYAARTTKQRKQKQQAKKQEQQRQKEFQNPKKPTIADDRAVLGSKDAEITIIKYADFECPYCQRTVPTIKKVREKYGDNIRFMFKHFPLDNHPHAMISAKYFEAIAMQNTRKAYKYYHQVFNNQKKLKNQGETFLKQVARDLNVDMDQLQKDIQSEEVATRIKNDKKEAERFGISGTPSFLINGVSLHGAQPYTEFNKIIQRHLNE